VNKKGFRNTVGAAFTVGSLKLYHDLSMNEHCQ